MIDEAKAKALAEVMRAVKPTYDSYLDDEGESLRLRNIDLEDELLRQYAKTKRIMDDCMSDREITPNQKASVSNAVIQALGHLVKLQEDLKLQQAMKRMEGVLIEVLQTLPEQARNKFFEDYEKIATREGLL